VDVGNTFIKVGAFQEEKFLWSSSLQDIDDVISSIERESPAQVFVSSVRKEIKFDGLDERINIFHFGTQTKLPIKINYKQAENLGTDRIAAAAGAAVLFPEKNNLVFDLGTCLTHGLVDKTATFQGGSISPGLDMRLKALAHFTAKLPLLSAQSDEIVLTGQSTTESIMSGVINGIAFEIEGFIRAYQNKYGPINVLLTGGNALLFEKMLKEAIFVVPELNLIGLNRILNYNA